MRVHERWSVSGAPGELGDQTHSDTVLDEVLWRDGANLILALVVESGGWVELGELIVRHGSDISCIAHGLELGQVLHVVNQVESVVPLHGDIKCLHLLSGVAAARDGTTDLVGAVHELLVLGLDLVNNVWGVDPVAVAIPIDLSGLLGLVWSVIVVKH